MKAPPLAGGHRSCRARGFVAPQGETADGDLHPCSRPLHPACIHSPIPPATPACIPVPATQNPHPARHPACPCSQVASAICPPTCLSRSPCNTDPSSRGPSPLPTALVPGSLLCHPPTHRPSQHNSPAAPTKHAFHPTMHLPVPARQLCPCGPHRACLPSPWPRRPAARPPAEEAGRQLTQSMCAELAPPVHMHTQWGVRGAGRLAWCAWGLARVCRQRVQAVQWPLMHCKRRMRIPPVCLPQEAPPHYCRTLALFRRWQHAALLIKALLPVPVSTRSSSSSGKSNKGRATCKWCCWHQLIEWAVDRCQGLTPSSSNSSEAMVGRKPSGP